MKSFRPTLSIFIFFMFLMILIPGCGSDKGISSDTNTTTITDSDTETGTDTSTDTDTETDTGTETDTETDTSTDTETDTSTEVITIGDISLSASSYSISPEATITITATVYSQTGNLIPNIDVGFSLDAPALASINSTATTSSEGVATATLTARSISGSVMVSAFIETVISSSPVTIVILDTSSTTPVAIDISSNPTSLLVEGTSTITASVWSDSEKKTAVPDGTTVAFELANSLYGSVSTTSTTISGKATATFEASSQAGYATINATSGTATGAVNVQILPSSAVAISFLSAEPDIIALEGSGGNEISTVQFIVKDSNDDPVSNMNVAVSLVGPNGGEYIDDSDDTPETIEVSTGLDGIASVRLHSGSVTGPATLSATINVESDTTMTSKSSVVSIGGGVPSWKRFSTASELLNLPGLVYINKTTTVSAYLADRYGNFNILDGTTVSFICEKGAAIDTNQVTSLEEGVATVTLRTQSLEPEDVEPDNAEIKLLSYIDANYPNENFDFSDPENHPRDGLCSILAYTKGEEHYDDTDADGSYDSSVDTFNDKEINWSEPSLGGYDTPADPFIDYNDDNEYTGSDNSDPEEIYINSGDTDYNGVWDGNKYIFDNHRILITGSPNIYFDRSFNVSNAGSDVISMLVCDRNFNPLTPGSTITLSASAGDLNWTSHTFANSNATPYVILDTDGVTEIKAAYIEFFIVISDPDPEDTDPVSIETITVNVEWEGVTYVDAISGFID